MLVVAAVVIEAEGDARKLLRVTLPLGMQLLQGTRVIVDQDQPVNAPYVICLTNDVMPVRARCTETHQSRPAEFASNPKAGD